MLQHSVSDRIGPEKGIFFAYWTFFFTRKINLSKLWFLMKKVCIGIMYFNEMIIIKDGKDIPNGPFLQWSLSIHTCCAGLQIFFKIGGPKWPMEQKMMGHFLKWWAHCWLYSKTCLKRPLKKEDQLSLNAGQKYCRMLQREHSAILSTFIKQPFVIKIFVLSFFSGCLR